MNAKTMASKIVKGETTAKDAAAIADGMKLLSEQIKAIDDAMKRIEAGPLKRRAILLLLKDISRVPYQDIDEVFKAMSRLRSEFVK